MIRRVLVLAIYFQRRFVLSLPGILFLLLALVFYMIFFGPGQKIPDVAYFASVLGIFGTILSFLVTLSLAATANRAANLPILVRIPSRVEYLTSVLLASIVFSSIVLLALAIVALLVNGPIFNAQLIILIPPLWFSGILMFSTLALHASDLVAWNWSRVYVFGIIALLIYLREGLRIIGNALANLFDELGIRFSNQGWDALASMANSLGNLVSETVPQILERSVDVVFWPFNAIANALINSQFSEMQAIAPAILILYASILFLLAANVFSSKDLILSE
jgi:hypothetical protein